MDIKSLKSTRADLIAMMAKARGVSEDAIVAELAAAEASQVKAPKAPSPRTCRFVHVAGVEGKYPGFVSLESHNGKANNAYRSTRLSRMDLSAVITFLRTNAEGQRLAASWDTTSQSIPETAWPTFDPTKVVKS